jgi:exodeoxyribonuclease V alpha subunit
MAANNNPTMEVLAGLVERVTFHNEGNGFRVLRVKARGKREPITVVGHAAMVSAGEFLQATGEWANDRTRGVQFRARFLKSMAPTTTEGIEKYLGSGMIRGIGPAYARKLVGASGSQVFDDFKPYDRSDHAVYIANPEPLDLCMAACLKGRKDQYPVEPFGQIVK